MSKAIKISDLASVIDEELQDYVEQVTDAMKESAKDIAKQTKARIKQTAPKDTGDYAKGWGYKTLKEDGQAIGVVVYNKTEPQLTHLLEHGHAKVNGGRVEGKAHIGPAADSAVREFVADIKKAVKGD